MRERLPDASVRAFYGTGGVVSAGRSNPAYEARSYRAGMGAGRFRPFELEVGETDLWLGFDAESARNLPTSSVQNEVGKLVRRLRNEIIAYSEQCPSFLTSHTPVQAIVISDGTVLPELIQTMLAAGRLADVGPMAAVAGAIAEAVGRYCKERWKLAEVVVENGGDLYVDVASPLSVQVVAPSSPLSGKAAIRVVPEICPVGVCTSSGTVGHSYSYGKADAMMIVCKNAALADAWATACCNRIQRQSDIQDVCEQIREVGDIVAAVIVVADKIGLCGSLEVCAV